MRDITVNRFRQNRGRRLQAHIDRLADTLGRDIDILDVGGRPDYWDNVPLARVRSIVLLNNEEDQLTRSATSKDDLFSRTLGDATNLHQYADQSVDLVHSNSVIEHVGMWTNVTAMARETQRVGKAGWIQTPAWEFPIEPHYRLPFVHWLGAPARRKLISLRSKFKDMSLAERRTYVEYINILSRREFQSLYPDRDFFTEWVIFPKSYVASWLPSSALLDPNVGKTSN